MPRARTTKGLAKRIALDYFKRPSPLRSLRAKLTWGAALLALVIVALAISPTLVRLVRPRRESAPLGARSGPGAIAESVLSPGALSEAHAQFELECARCHGSIKTGVFLAKTSDNTCKVCHDGPIHQESQRLTPSCASCHAEHKGRALTKVRDAACTSCHAALEGALAAGMKGEGFDAHVTRFTPRRSSGVGHPEFAPLTRPDPGHLKLNHKAHLALKAEWLASQHLEPLECASCHEPDRSQMLMRPISYERHCARCHPLAFDAGGRFAAYPPGPVAPHDTPRAIRLFLTRAFAEEIAARPSRLMEPDPMAAPSPGEVPRRLLGREPPPPPPRTAAEWVAREVTGSEKILYGRDCVLCHELMVPAPVNGESAPPDSITSAASAEEPSRTLPRIAAANVPARWFTHARFDHRSHRLLHCEACHASSRTSTVSADVLAPGIETCAGCHRPGASRNDCALCHEYHDKRRERPIRGTLTLPARALEAPAP